MDTFHYRIIPGHVLYDRVELHVFARAYRECWTALHARQPHGRHLFERLGITIDFGAPAESA